MATADTAGMAAWVYAALAAGHWFGDHVVTRDAAMNAKAVEPPDPSHRQQPAGALLQDSSHD